MIKKMPDYDPRALIGFALIAERAGDPDAARVMRAAAKRIEQLEIAAEATQEIAAAAIARAQIDK